MIYLQGGDSAFPYESLSHGKHNHFAVDDLIFGQKIWSSF
jgi:hypothetical protein